MHFNWERLGGTSTFFGKRFIIEKVFTSSSGHPRVRGCLGHFFGDGILPIHMGTIINSYKDLLY